MDGLSGNVISLYAKGTTGDIQAHLAEIYGTEISRHTISCITDATVEDMVSWQNRPLDRVYPVILIDAIFVKVRDGDGAGTVIVAGLQRPRSPDTMAEPAVLPLHRSTPEVCC